MSETETLQEAAVPAASPQPPMALHERLNLDQLKIVGNFPVTIETALGPRRMHRHGYCVWYIVLDILRDLGEDLEAFYAVQAVPSSDYRAGATIKAFFEMMRRHDAELVKAVRLALAPKFAEHDGVTAQSQYEEFIEKGDHNTTRDAVLAGYDTSDIQRILVTFAQIHEFDEQLKNFVWLGSIGRLMLGPKTNGTVTKTEAPSAA